MGVPRDVVYEDYLRSNDYILPAYKKHIDAFTEAGGNPEIPLAILGVKQEYLDTAFDEMKEKYGTIENYFAEALNLDSEKQAQLKQIFLY